MPTLNYVLTVLKDNLNEGSVVCAHHRCVEIYPSTSRVVRYAPNPEDPVDLKVVSHLHGSVWGNERDAIDSIPLLSIHRASRVCKSDGPCRVDEPVVV